MFSVLNLMHCYHIDHSGHGFESHDRSHINGGHSSYNPVETADVEEDFNVLIVKDQ